jgi:hypothetical protein
MAAQLRAAVADDDRTPHAIAHDAGLDAKILGRFLAGERGLSLGSADRLAGTLGLRLGVAMSGVRARRGSTAAKAR